MYRYFAAVSIDSQKRDFSKTTTQFINFAWKEVKKLAENLNRKLWLKVRCLKLEIGR
jgi:hypothetical protein